MQKNNNKKNICLFLVSGHTFSFKEVYDIIDNENSITFKYVAMSDGKEKKAIFYKSSGGIVGISIYLEK